MAKDTKTSSTTKPITPLTLKEEERIMATALLKEFAEDAVTVGIAKIVYLEEQDVTIIVYKGKL